MLEGDQSSVNSQILMNQRLTFNFRSFYTLSPVAAQIVAAPQTSMNLAADSTRCFEQA